MRAEAELELIANIADGLPVAVWVAAAPDGRFVYANRAFEEILGTGPIAGAAAGKYAEPYGIYDRTGRLYPEERLPFARALAAGSTVVVDDLVIHRRDGRRVYVRAFAKPLVDEAGAISHVSIAFVDITREVLADEGRERAERENAAALAREVAAREEARASEARLRSVIERAPVVLYALDRNGVITLVKGLGLARLGPAAEVMLGQSVFELFRPTRSRSP